MIKTIIIEDEKQSREVLQLMLENYSNVIELVDSCDTAEKGMASIQKHGPQLVLINNRAHLF